MVGHCLYFLTKPTESPSDDGSAGRSASYCSDTAPHVLCCAVLCHLCANPRTQFEHRVGQIGPQSPFPHAVAPHAQEALSLLLKGWEAVIL